MQIILFLQEHQLLIKITGFLFLIVFIAIWIEERENILNYLAQAGLVVLNLNIVMMAIAYFLAKKFASWNSTSKMYIFRMWTSKWNLSSFCCYRNFK